MNSRKMVIETIKYLTARGMVIDGSMINFPAGVDGNGSMKVIRCIIDSTSEVSPEKMIVHYTIHDMYENMRESGPLVIERKELVD